MKDHLVPVVPAVELAKKTSRPFPNDSEAYRQARTALLAEEIELRRQIERVAEQRRALPIGGEIPRDFPMIDEGGKPRAFSDLFGIHDTLVTYQWMYGPDREMPCPMFTSFIGALDTPARDIQQRVAFAVIGRSPIPRQLDFKRARGWRNLPFFQSLDDRLARDYRALTEQGDEMPVEAP